MIEVKGKVSLDGRGWENGLRTIKGATKDFSNDLNGSLKGQLAAVFSVAAITEASRRVIEYAGTINDLAARAGVGTEALQAMGYAAQQNGSSLETMVKFLEQINLTRAKALGGDEQSQASFSALGVSGADLKTKRAEDITQTIANAIKNGDAQALIDPLRAVGGKGAAELIAAFKDGLAEKMDEAKEGGHVIADAVIKQLDEAGDRIDSLKGQMLAGWAPIVVGVIDGFQAIIDAFDVGISYWYSFVQNLDFKALLMAAVNPLKDLPTEIANQFKTADAAGITAGKMAQADIVQREEDRIKRMAEKSPIVDVFAPITEPKEKEAKTKAQEKTPGVKTDSLLQVGNFLGAGANTISTIATDHLTEAKKQTHLLMTLVANSKTGEMNYTLSSKVA